MVNFDTPLKIISDIYIIGAELLSDPFLTCNQEVNLAYENVKEVDGLDVSKEGSESWEAAIKR